MPRPVYVNLVALEPAEPLAEFSNPSLQLSANVIVLNLNGRRVDRSICQDISFDNSRHANRYTFAVVFLIIAIIARREPGLCCYVDCSAANSPVADQTWRAG